MQQGAQDATADTQQELRWADVLDGWGALELDLHDLLGIDMEDPTILHGRTWRWLHLRILDCIDRPSRIRRHLNLTTEHTQ